jgi:hypothetical protein
MSQKLIDSTMLFRFAIPLLPWKGNGPVEPLELPDAFRIPSFAELDGRAPFADLRIGWNEEGIITSLRVKGKRQQTWCRESKLDDSDGLQLFIDTRNTRDIHRASRFCHRFVFLPHGADRNGAAPLARPMPILRAKENPKFVDPAVLSVRAKSQLDGYILQCWIPAQAMTGYDTSEHSSLGFFYLVADRELGWQTFSLGPEYPITSDPSLWGTVELVR